MILHPFPPLYDSNSRILILGSFPSVKSREENFFYGHPQNRFWKITSEVFKQPLPRTIEEKKDFLHSNGIALWDVIASCDIDKSSDGSIRNVIANDIRPIIDNAPIEKIFVNGKTAQKYYDKYTRPVIGIEAAVLPSTSPANAAWTLDRLTEAWKAVILST